MGSVTHVTSCSGSTVFIAPDRNFSDEPEFIYAGGVYAEDRRCHRLAKGPVAGQPFALGFGSKIFAAAHQSITLPAWPTTVEALKAQGLELLSAALRNKNYRFVFDTQ